LFQLDHVNYEILYDTVMKS